MRAASEIVEVSQCLVQDTAPCRHPSTVRVSFWTSKLVSVYLHKANVPFFYFPIYRGSIKKCNFQSDCFFRGACLILKNMGHHSTQKNRPTAAVSTARVPLDCS